MYKGTVQRFAPSRGCGTILTDDGEGIFVHCRDVCDCAGRLRHGDRVEFLLVAVGGEFKAIDVHRLGAQRLNPPRRGGATAGRSSCGTRPRR